MKWGASVLGIVLAGCSTAAGGDAALDAREAAVDVNATESSLSDTARSDTVTMDVAPSDDVAFDVPPPIDAGPLSDALDVPVRDVLRDAPPADTRPLCGADAGIVPAICPLDDSTWVDETPGIRPGFTASPCNRATELVLTPADDLHAMVMAAPTGRTICLTAGRYRVTQVVTLRTGQTLRGEPGVVLTGSVPVTGFTPMSTGGGTVYRATFTLPLAPASDGQAPCTDMSAMPCNHHEDVFIGMRGPLRVGSLGAVTAGTFFIAYPASGSTVTIYLGDDPGSNPVEIAAYPTAVQLASDHTTVESITAERFANGAQRGAIEASGNAVNVTIHHCVARQNHGVGLRLSGAGTGAVIADNDTYENAQMGIGAAFVSNARIEHNAVHDNNPRRLFYTLDGAVGGIKVDGRSSNVDLRFNTLAANQGIGIWIDQICSAITIEGNDIATSHSDGIRYEISHSPLIRHNTLTGNATASECGTLIYCGAGITAYNVDQGCIYRNTVTGNLNGIVLRESARRSTAGTPPDLHDVYVYDNTVTMGGASDVQHTGVHRSANAPLDPYAPAQHIEFFRNTYHLSALTNRSFYWGGAGVDRTTWTGADAQDVCGTFLSP